MSIHSSWSVLLLLVTIESPRRQSQHRPRPSWQKTLHLFSLLLWFWMAWFHTSRSGDRDWIPSLFVDHAFENLPTGEHNMHARGKKEMRRQLRALLFNPPTKSCSTHNWLMVPTTTTSVSNYLSGLRWAIYGTVTHIMLKLMGWGMSTFM